VEILPVAAADTVEAKIDRIVKLGFAGRVEMLTVNENSEVWAQLTTSELESLNLSAGQLVYIRPKGDAVVKEDTGALDQIIEEENLDPASDKPTAVTPGLPV